MEAAYYLSTVVVLFVIITTIIGIVRPATLRKLFGHHATRPRIFLVGSLLFFIFGGILTTTEPESVRLARAEQQRHAKQTSDVQPKTKETSPINVEKTEPKPAKKTTDVPKPVAKKPVATPPAVSKKPQASTIAPPRSTAAKPAPRKCHPSYTGQCVPIASDADCAGGSGNGPVYVHGVVHVVGPDVYGLDRNKNGLGCE